MARPQQHEVGIAPLAALPIALKVLGNGFTWAAIVGGFFGVKLLFANMKIDRQADKIERVESALETEQTKTRNLTANVQSLQNQASRKVDDAADKKDAKDALDDEADTNLAPPSIKRAIGILREQQETDETESASDADGGESDVRRRARGTKRRGE